MRHDGRKLDELRKVEILRGFTSASPGSVLIRAGNTHVLHDEGKDGGGEALDQQAPARCAQIPDTRAQRLVVHGILKAVGLPGTRGITVQFEIDQDRLRRGLLVRIRSDDGVDTEIM